MVLKQARSVRRREMEVAARYLQRVYRGHRGRRMFVALLDHIAVLKLKKGDLQTWAATARPSSLARASQIGRGSLTRAKSSTASITVNVQDVNEAPFWKSEQYTISVWESSIGKSHGVRDYQNQLSFLALDVDQDDKDDGSSVVVSSVSGPHISR